MQRITQPPGIQSGGFAGGVATGAPEPVRGNELLDLAESLGGFSQAFTGAANTFFKNRLEDQVRDSEDQRRDAAKLSEQIIAEELRGYNAQQIGAALETEPMVARFKENPYLLPAINIHRGRTMANEASLKVIEDGVDVRDQKAVSEWLRKSIGEMKDPFVAQGFNEQWERHGAQFAQMQLKETLERAEQDRADMGASEWTFQMTTAKEAGLDIKGQVAAAYASIEGLIADKHISPAEAAEIEIAQLRIAAQNGDVELAEAIAMTPRGSAPSLMEDGRLSLQTNTYLNQAREEKLRRDDGQHVMARSAMFDLIRSGATLQKIESMPEMQMLKGADPTKWSEVRERWYAHQEEAARESARNLRAAQGRALLNDVHSRAAEVIADGRGEFLQDQVIDLGEGGVIRVSASEQRQQGLVTLRSRMFPEGFENVPDEQIQRIRTYTRRLADSNMKDPMLEGYFQGTMAYLTPEGLKDNEDVLVGAYKLYKNMDPGIARQYFDDAKSAAVFANIDRIMTANPKTDLKQAASRAVAMANRPVTFDLPPKDIREAAEQVRVLDPLNPNQGFFGIGAGENRQAVALDRIAPYITERASELMSYGLPKAEAIGQAKREAESQHVLVYGKPVQLPSEPGAPAPTQKAWAEVITKALDHAAWSSGAKAEDYTLTYMGGEQYLLKGPPTEKNPSGTISYPLVKQLYALAANREAVLADDEKWKRTNAAINATYGSGKPAPAPPPPPKTLR